MKTRMIPAEGIAGEVGTFKLEITIGKEPVQIGGWVKIVPFRKVANNWVSVQNAFPRRENYLSVVMPKGVTGEVEVEAGWSIIVKITHGRLNPQDKVVIVYGDRSSGSPGLRLGALASRAEFRIYQCSDSSHGEEEVAQTFFDVVPDKPAELRIRMRKVPDKKSILLRAAVVDRFGNTAESAPSPLEIEPVVGLEAAGRLNLPAAGKALVETEIKVTDELSHPRIEIGAPALGLKAQSDPVSLEKQIFWGDIHCHTRLAQALETPEFLYDYARNDAALDFLCHVEHYCGASEGWISEEEWQRWHTKPATLRDYIRDAWAYHQELVKGHYEPGCFVTLLGFEWASNIYGHMNVIFPVDEEELVYPRSFFDESESPDGLYRALSEKEAIIIPHHPSWPVGRKVSGVDWRFYDRRLTRLVEICSKHGVSEYFGCPDAIDSQAPEGTVRNALSRGYHLSFVGSTDSHASRPGSWGIPGDLWAVRGGIAAVFAERLDRASIYEALKMRRCYATTGGRMILEFSVNDSPMGSEITCAADAERIISGGVIGTGKIEYLELIKNGEAIFCQRPAKKREELSFVYADRQPIRKEDYYYMRVVQADGHQAWASPVWVDTEG